MPSESGQQESYPLFELAPVAALLLGAFAIVSCTTVSEPLPSLAEQIDAPAAYEHWWAMTQECSGRTGDFASIQWYVVPGATSMKLSNGEVVDGYWDNANHRIVLAGTVQLWGDVVRHEMLHALLGNTRGHPRAQFIQRCGGVVACEAGCRNEETPALPDSTWTHVKPTQLPVTFAVDPESPGSTLNNGTFVLIVSVTNSRDEPVVVDLDPSGDDGPPISFAYDLLRSQNAIRLTYDARAWVPETMWFAPGETKRFVFDFVIGGGLQRYNVIGGTYTAIVAYGGHLSPPQTLVVSW
jgi:hypothetical protein